MSVSLFVGRIVHVSTWMLHLCRSCTAKFGVFNTYSDNKKHSDLFHFGQTNFLSIRVTQ